MTRYAKFKGQDGDRLDSWKAIAAYLGKSVRTAIRWAQEEGMPVYRHAGSKRGAVYAFRSELDEWIHADRSPPPRIARKSSLLWAGASVILILAAVTVLLWLNRSTEEVPIPVGERPWVLFSDFDNQTEEPRFDGTVETALRRELARSRHVLVVAPERVRNILVLMQRPPDTPIDTELGREICLRYVEDCAVLVGRMDKYGTHYLFSVEVVAPADGLIVASSEQEAEDEDEILPAIRRLGVWLRNHMGEELAQIDFEGDQLQNVTTHSLRALELYSRGERAYRQYRFDEAENFFRQAIAADPGFASAYQMLYYAISALYYGKPPPEEARDALQRAMELAETASEQERLFIEGTYYAGIEEDLEKACVTNKVLAELYPDHYWAAGNAAMYCGLLGRREDSYPLTLQAAEVRTEWLWNCSAASKIVFFEGDFDRARRYIERASELHGNKFGAALGFPLACTELFAAKEYFHHGMLTDVLGELQRVERMAESLENDVRRPMIKNLVPFHLALGRFHKVQALSGAYTGTYRYPELLQSWLAYLRGDEAAFRENLEEFRIAFRDIDSDPNRRLSRLVRWVIAWQLEGGFMLDILGPLYAPEEAEALVADRSDPFYLQHASPHIDAKLQLLRGYRALDQGNALDAESFLRSGVLWFRDHGFDFSYFFVGSELLAVALIQSGQPDEAYQVLADAEQQNMVNYITAPLYHKLRARQALLARELERTAEAKAIEAELQEALALADEDHPILLQIREHLDERPGIE